MPLICGVEAHAQEIAEAIGTDLVEDFPAARKFVVGLHFVKLV